MSLKYKDFIQDCFYLKDKQGRIIPFTFNDVQDDYYTVLKTDYPDMQGIRENVLKGRQFGLSTMWGGIFTTDFIMSGIGEIELTNSDIYSYKDEDTRAHFDRVNLFLNSWLLKSQGGDYAIQEHRKELEPLRRAFLKIDTTNFLETKNGTQIQTKTASAKVSGRGNTKQNIHWTEPAFYPNTEILSAEDLMTGAEEQVPQGYGKIVRESTGNLAADYYAKEYYLGKSGKSDFKSRFIAWYSHKDYRRFIDGEWEAPEYYEKILSTGLATLEQCYWHFVKTRELTDKKKLREYPTKDFEAFLLSGTTFFDSEALLHYANSVAPSIKEVEYATAL
ncbi:MAG: hypothetical protein EOO27_02315 [Comamonadaceae bacterium]|nr:MAG: hypothetical protein EOO27_02315 [Comamonadaceae bacterium]